MLQPHDAKLWRLARHAATLGAVGVLVALTAGCGGGADSAAGSASGGAADTDASLTRIDACGLLSPAEVGQALGVAVSEPTRRESGTETSLATICVYDGGWPNSVNLTLRQSVRAGAAGSSAELADELNDDLDAMAADSSMADLVEGGRWEALEIAGHAAAVRDAGEGGWTVAARKDGRRAVEVLINAPTRESGVALARTVLGKLSA